MSSVSVRIDLAGVNRKLGSAAMIRGRRAMANQALEDMNRVVPRRSGKLRGSGHVTNGGSSIVWSARYAYRQFNGNGISHYSTPGTGPHWDRKAAGLYKSSWATAFKRGAGL